MIESFQFSDGKVANSTQELLKLCQQNPDLATNFLINQDLEKWLAYIGDYEIAECAIGVRQTEMSDRQKLEEFIARYHSITQPQAVPAAVTETNVENNPTTPELTAPINKIPQQPFQGLKVDPATATVSKSTEAIPPKSPAESDQKNLNSSRANNKEKPSFLQVVATLIIKILY